MLINSTGEIFIFFIFPYLKMAIRFYKKLTKITQEHALTNLSPKRTYEHDYKYKKVKDPFGPVHEVSI